MNRIIVPPSLAPTAARYAHAVMSVDPTTTLYTSGIVPIDASGSVPEGLAEQADVVWSNLLAILEEAHMEVSDIVSVTTYVVHGEDLSVVMAARDRHLVGHLAASTLLTVPALARPEWRLEVSLIAST